MPRSYFLLLVLLAFSLTARAQSGGRFGFEYQPVAKVVHGPDTLRNAWAGGLNTPQFSSIDLNGDGQLDLFAFDHESSRCQTFLSVAAPGTPAGRRWQYAPQYESLFPADLQGWALLRDYDCDNRPDLFTYSGNGGVYVYRNVATTGPPSFQLAATEIRYSGNFVGTANLVVGGYNLPAIQDVNGDGKLDIMTYDFGGSSFIEQLINTSPGPCGGALAFTLATDNWGGLQACGGCAEYQFNNQPCFTARRPTHTGGHSLLLVDLDGDGDQDLLDGRDNCPELVRLLNEGTTTAPVVTRAGISSQFPSAATPVNVPVFPAGYAFDANFDGRPDLVVAPNMVNNLADQVSLRNNVQLFENGPSGPPTFTYRPAGFLQPDMLDVSEGAAPTFGDLDGDGLPDMLIGNHADRVGTAYRASLSYYRNAGTRTRPVFQLVSSDYLGLAALNMQGLKPVLVDLNRDGALDLAYASFAQGVNLMYFVLNTAAAGQPVALSLASRVAFKPQGPATTGVLPYTKGDMPCFTDVDGDGYVDLLIGTNEVREPGMALRYFRNRARGSVDSAFVLADNDFGRIREATGIRPFNLSATVADFDGDGRPDLVTADATGLLRLFSNYRAQSGIFSERTDVVYNPANGQFELARLGKGTYVRYALAAADLNGDGAPELLVGTQAGGILSYGTRNRVVTAARTEAARALALSIFPNPATATATVETAAPTRLTVLDLTGRVVQTGAAPLRRHALSLAGLAAGVYLVRVVGADGATAVQRLAVQ